MDKKYEILQNESIEFDSRTLYRIRALRDFGDVHKGQIGGYVSNEHNLSNKGDCWIYNNAKCMDYARVINNAKMYHNSCMYDNSVISDDSSMFDDSKMFGHSCICDYGRLFDNAKMHDDSVIMRRGKMYSNSEMHGNSSLEKNGRLDGDSVLKDNMVLYGRLYSKCDRFYDFIENYGHKTVTAILKDGEILYNVGCQIEITEDIFLYRIHNHDGGIEKHPYRKEYLKIIEMSKIVFDNIK